MSKCDSRPLRYTFIYTAHSVFRGNKTINNFQVIYIFEKHLTIVLLKPTSFSSGNKSNFLLF